MLGCLSSNKNFFIEYKKFCNFHNEMFLHYLNIKPVIVHNTLNTKKENKTY